MALASGRPFIPVVDPLLSRFINGFLFHGQTTTQEKRRAKKEKKGEREEGKEKGDRA